jgi:putative DNA primase/helicase
VLADLANAGFGLFTSATQRAFFDSAQKWGHKQPSFRVATKIGWNGSTYVLPDQTFNLPGRTSSGKSNVYPVLDELDPNMIAKYRASNNSLQEWQEKIGKLCVNNSRLMFAVALAFTGPVLRFVRGEQSGGFQIYGLPETGKTAAAMVAGSVWGCRRDQPQLGFLASWNTTANAVELTALAHDDGLLILDETRKAGSTNRERLKVVTEVAMRLAERQAKKRLGDAPKLPSWRCYFLSTSNFSLDELAAKADGEVDNADHGRLVDIPLPNHAYGIYEDLHDSSSGSELTDRLKLLCRTYYGVPVREFISRLLHEIGARKSGKMTGRSVDSMYGIR